MSLERSTQLDLKHANWEDIETETTIRNSAHPYPQDRVLATVILPAFNEALALPKVLVDVHDSLDNCFEVIVVDDGSTDDTACIAEKFPCRVIRHRHNRGKGAAVRTGIQFARGQHIVIMDADATYPPSAIPHLVDLLQEYDLVRCTRQVSRENMPVINQLGNRLFDFLLSDVLRLAGDDQLSGLYGLRRNALVLMNLESDGFDIEAEINFKSRARGLKVATFPIVYQPRLGDKKLHAWRDGWRILNRILYLLLMYKSSLIFISLGLTLMVSSLLGATSLRESSLLPSYFGLSIHSFILAALGILSGLHLMTFGLAAALYATEAGYQPKLWAVKLCSAKLRSGAAGIGIGLVTYAIIYLLGMLKDWRENFQGPFYDTQNLILAATVLIWGLQLLAATLFISIFATRLRQTGLEK